MLQMNAYAEDYLDDAMKNLGEAFDYAVNCCGKNADEFMQLFIASKIADYFGNGNPKYVVGKTGTELVMDVIAISGQRWNFSEPKIEYDFTAEYWAGWILAYYQWKTGRTFRDIYNYFSMQDILKLYPTLHEASEEKFVETLNRMLLRQKRETRLQEQRKICGYSQRELAKQSGVNLRTLQQYESGAKDIGKASALTVITLAKTLGCSVEDIMEYHVV